MSQVLISTKYQVVIPKNVRMSLDLKPGQKLSCIITRGVIHFMPDRPIKSMRGFIKKKFSLDDLREKNDRII